VDSVQFRNNVQASLLYMLAMCPGAWFCAAGAGLYALFRRRRAANGTGESGRTDPMTNPFLGAVACLVLPVAVLWRDADVQIHPRYVLVALPGSMIFCVSLYRRWVKSKRGPVIWAAVQILVFGAALAVLAPYRQTQTRKMEFARTVRDSVPDEGLLFAGNLSPVLDYYRGIGVRPRWQVFWSGWDWDAGAAGNAIRRAWAGGIPVYVSGNPAGWFNFEGEFLDLHYLLKDCRQEQVAPMLFRVLPP
jgi:hypothetical protein